MASTPKVVRRTFKRMQREVSNYFGFPVRARVNLGIKSNSTVKLKREKAKARIRVGRSDILLDGRVYLPKLREILRHEFFHVAEVSSVTKSMGETIALLGTIEEKISQARDQKTEYERAIFHLALKTEWLKNVGPDFVVAKNILAAYPDATERKLFLRKLIKRNAEVIEEARSRGIKYIQNNELGEFRIEDVNGSRK